MTPGVFYNCLEIRANLLKPLRLNAFPFDGLMTPTLKAAGSNPVGRTKWMRVGVLNSFLRLSNTPTLIPWEKALVFQVFSFLLHSSVIHIAKIKDASLVVEK